MGVSVCKSWYLCSFDPRLTTVESPSKLSPQIPIVQYTYIWADASTRAHITNTYKSAITRGARLNERISYAIHIAELSQHVCGFILCVGHKKINKAITCQRKAGADLYPAGRTGMIWVVVCDIQTGAAPVYDVTGDCAV